MRAERTQDRNKGPGSPCGLGQRDSNKPLPCFGPPCPPLGISSRSTRSRSTEEQQPSCRPSPFPCFSFDQSVFPRLQEEVLAGEKPGPGGRASDRSPAADHCAAWPSTWKSAREGVTVRGWPDTFINQETHWYPLPGSSSRQEAAGSRWTWVRAAEGLGDQIPPSHPGVSEAGFKS